MNELFRMYRQFEGKQNSSFFHKNIYMPSCAQKLVYTNTQLRTHIIVYIPNILKHEYI